MATHFDFLGKFRVTSLRAEGFTGRWMKGFPGGFPWYLYPPLRWMEGVFFVAYLGNRLGNKEVIYVMSCFFFVFRNCCSNSLEFSSLIHTRNKKFTIKQPSSLRLQDDPILRISCKKWKIGTLKNYHLKKVGKGEWNSGFSGVWPASALDPYTKIPPFPNGRHRRFGWPDLSSTCRRFGRIPDGTRERGANRGRLMMMVGWLVADFCPPETYVFGNKQSATDGTNQVGSKYWWIVPRVFGGLKNRATSTTVVDDVVVRHV